MNTILTYVGGKTSELDKIRCHVPLFDGRYIEPFFGGGALFFDLEPKNAIINDINESLMNFYRYVRDDYDNFFEELFFLNNLYKKNEDKFKEDDSIDLNSQLYYYLRDRFNGFAHKEVKDKYPELLSNKQETRKLIMLSYHAIYYYINKTAYSGLVRYNKRGDFNVPYGFKKKIKMGVVNHKHSLLLQKTQILNGDYHQAFMLANDDDFMFLDPPYDCSFNSYGNANSHQKDGFTDEMQKRLAYDFKNLKCKALMVIGATPHIETLYKNYIVDEYEKAYNINVKNRMKANSRHLIIKNNY